MSPSRRRRAPHITRAEVTARRVLNELGIARATETAIETLAYMRGVLVRESPSRGARATLVKVGGRGVVGVAPGLRCEERRFAVAHELGHFEMHEAHSYAGLCRGTELLSSYANDGHEEEANAFAAELLMPGATFGKACDVAAVDWSIPRRLAQEFQVSLTAAAIRFTQLCPERTALVCSKAGKVAWVSRGPDFGLRIAPGERLDSYTLAYDYFRQGAVPAEPEEVAMTAWNPGAGDGDLVEHAFVLPNFRCVLSLLWIPPSDED